MATQHSVTEKALDDMEEISRQITKWEMDIDDLTGVMREYEQQMTSAGYALILRYHENWLATRSLIAVLNANVLEAKARLRRMKNEYVYSLNERGARS